MTDYAEHLDTRLFDKPVRFRIEANGETILPTYEIGNILGRQYGLDQPSEYDAALFVDETRAEFAFDAAVVDADEVLNDVRTLLDNYNIPPEDLSEDAKGEWRSITVTMTDVDR